MFAVTCLDKPGHAGIRQANRPDHLAFMQARLDRIVLAGPLFDDAGGMIGSLLVLDYPDRAAVEAHLAADPYTKADLFDSVVIRPFKRVFP